VLSNVVMAVNNELLWVQHSVVLLVSVCWVQHSVVLLVRVCWVQHSVVLLVSVLGAAQRGTAS
jgi:hypothetical protein